MEELRVEEDEDLRFTFKSIAEKINEQLEEEEAQLEDTWDLKLSDDNAMVYIKKKGSKHDSKSHYSYSDLHFNAEFNMIDIINAIYHEAKRLEWDTNILILNKDRKNKNFWINYQQNKAPMKMESKDFVDKYVAFSYKGAFYNYQIAVTEAESEKFELPAKTSRARTIIGL